MVAEKPVPEIRRGRNSVNMVPSRSTDASLRKRRKRDKLLRFPKFTFSCRALRGSTVNAGSLPVRGLAKCSNKEDGFLSSRSKRLSGLFILKVKTQELSLRTHSKENVGLNVGGNVKKSYPRTFFIKGQYSSRGGDY